MKKRKVLSSRKKSAGGGVPASDAPTTKRRARQPTRRSGLEGEVGEREAGEELEGQRGYSDDWDAVDETGWDSFPASDPPPR